MKNEINSKKLELFLNQKETLDTLLEHGAITQAQHDFSLNGLRDKMGITEEDEKINNK